MHDKVVDGFVGDGTFALVFGEGRIDVWRGRKHRKDGFGIGERKCLALPC